MGTRAWRGRGGVASAIVAMLAVTACGGTDTGAGESGGGDGDGVTLTLTGLTDQADAMDALIEAYAEVEPDVTIDANYAPVDQLQTSLRAQLGAGNAPDLHVVWPGNGSAMAKAQLADAGLLTELESAPWMEHVPEGLQPLLGTDGEAQMWSPGVAVIGTIYNEQVFAEAGVEIPETWGELLDVGEKLKAAGVVPFALGNQTPWVTQLMSYAIAPSTAFAEDPELAENMLSGEKTFATSGWREVFERYMQLNELGYFNDNPNGTTVEQQINLVATGEAAMAVHVSATQPQIEAAAEGRAEIGFFPFPANDEPGELRIPAGVSAGLGVSPNSDHAAEAAAFLEFIGQPEQMVEYSRAVAILPFGSQGDEDIDPLLVPFAPFVDNDMATPFMDQQWPNAEVQPVHFAMVQELFSGQSTIDEALAALDEAYVK